MIWTSIHSRVAPAYVEEWRHESRVFEDIAAWHDGRVNLTGRGEPIEVYADRVTPNFFSVLGVSAVIGRTFTVAPTFTSVEREVVLSHRWLPYIGLFKINAAMCTEEREGTTRHSDLG